MIVDHLKPAINSALAAEITFRSLGDDEAQVYVPFEFPDGDGLVVHVRDLRNSQLEITDNGHTLIHLSYHTDLKRLSEGQRAELLERIVLRHGLEDRGGEFVLPSSRPSIGTDVFRFSQALLEISDLRNLDREIVRSAFREDFVYLIGQHFPQATHNFVDRDHDPKAEYKVPFMLNGVTRPIAIFDVNNDERALEAVVIAKQLREWGHSMYTVAIEEGQQGLTRRHVAWLSAAFDKQFPALAGNEDDIVTYLRHEYSVSQRLSTP